MSSDSGNLELALVVGFFGGIVTFFKGFRAYRRYRIVEDTPEIPIRSIPMGLVHIHGKAKGAQLVTSPVTRTPCCFYKVDIERWKSDSEGGGGWQHFRTDADGPRFYLEDGSGRVLVDAHGADCDLEKSCQREVRGSSGSNASPGAVSGQAGPATDAELLSYVARSTAAKALGFIGRGAERIGPLADPGKEQIRLAIADAFTHPLAGKGFQALMALQLPALRQKLEAKGPLSDPQQEQARLAMIEATSHQVGSPEFFDAIRHVSELAGSQAGRNQGGEHFEVWTATLRGLGEHGLGAVQFSSASGHYRLTEYCILPDHDYDVTGTCAENPQPADEHDRNLITKGSNEPTFLISYKALPEVESGLRKQAALMIFGGAGLAVVCLGILLAKLGLF